MNEDKKLILKTSLITLGIIVLVTIIVFCINILCFPAKTADFLFDLGMKSFASDLYFKEYKNSNDINYLNKALNIKIELGYNENIVEYSEEFFAHDDYSEFISELNQANLETNFNLYTKSKLIAEDNYYKNAYIKALVAIDKVDEAYNFSKSTFDDTTPTFKDLKVYVFSHLIGNIENSKFNEKLNDSDEVVLYEKINTYFEDLYELFEVTTVNFAEDEEVYIYALSSRILQVGNDLKAIADKAATTLNVAEIEVKLNATANFMQALLEE